MKLNNKWIELIDTNTGNKYLLAGNGSQELFEDARSRIGLRKFSNIEGGRINSDRDGSANESLCLLGSDFHLFNAYGILEKGMEMSPDGYYDLEKYEYYCYDGGRHIFEIMPIDYIEFIGTGDIIARKLKKVFKWRNDRAPKREDADIESLVVIPANKYLGCIRVNYMSDIAQQGTPWATSEDTKHFTEENPAPPFYTK